MLYFARSRFKIVRRLRKVIEKRLYYKYHCDISRSADIDSSVNFVHPVGIIIGSNAIIGKNCIIYQNVTIGATTEDNAMPIIGDGTSIYAGSVVLGGITIGKNCIIGANSVITKSVLDNTKVVGVNKIVEK